MLIKLPPTSNRREELKTYLGKDIQLSLPSFQIERRGLPLTPESLASIPPFASITFNTDDGNGGDCKPEVAKTGLGSSAAMTTAVVGALLHYLG